tara:strand:- start:273 stop:770 length:498 start_codon:yes stop_codon:yes gene_type:complete
MPVEQSTKATSVAEVSSNNIVAVSQELTLDLCQSKWGGFLTKLKSMHTGLFTILRQSQVMTLNKHCIELKLFQPVQFFVDKLTEQTYKGLLEKFLAEFYSVKLTFKVYDPNLNSSENSTQQSDGDTLASNFNGATSNSASKNTEKKIQDELSLNQIISLFEGKVL